MQKYEYMKIERDGNGVSIAHSSGEFEYAKNKQRIIHANDIPIEVINEYAKEGWRVVVGGGSKPSFVIMERPIEK